MLPSAACPFFIGLMPEGGGMSRQQSQFPLLATVLLSPGQFARLEAACAQRRLGKSQLLRALVEEHLPEIPTPQAGTSAPIDG
jgi:hypothetical protein